MKLDRWYAFSYVGKSLDEIFWPLVRRVELDWDCCGQFVQAQEFTNYQEWINEIEQSRILDSKTVFDQVRALEPLVSNGNFPIILARTVDSSVKKEFEDAGYQLIN